METQQIYPSEMACKALGLRTTGTPTKEKGGCCLCGRPIAPGELANKFAPGGTFTDDVDLVGREQSDRLPTLMTSCQYCYPFLGKVVMQATQQVVITPSGLHPFAKIIHRKHLLINPPKTAVWLSNNTQLGHVIWRAAVSDSDLLQIQLGATRLKIRHKVLLEARDIITAYQVAHGGKRPFVRLPDFGMGDTYGICQLTSSAMQDLSPSSIERLTSLTMGEYWATAIIISPHEAEEPPLLTSVDKQKTK